MCVCILCPHVFAIAKLNADFYLPIMQFDFNTGEATVHSPPPPPPPPPTFSLPVRGGLHGFCVCLTVSSFVWIELQGFVGLPLVSTF